MIAKTLILAALATNVAAGPCKPGGLSSNIFTTSTESSVESTTLGSVATTSSEQETTTTGEAPTTTTTSTSEPAGNAIIFQVNPQRRLSKRDTTYLGSNNPTECTFATAFRLDSDQLLENGVPIYYAGQGYQEFAAQGQPPADAVTKTFSIARGRLVWTNDAFGQASFCQTQSDGKVYITFDSAPSGCEAVSLTAYRESQCQNGQIVDAEASSVSTTSAAESTSSARGTPSTEATTSTEVNFSSDKVTSSTEGTSSAEATSSAKVISPTEATTSTKANSSDEVTSSTELTTSAKAITSTEVTSSDEATSSDELTSSAKVITSTEVTSATKVKPSTEATTSTKVASSAEVISSMEATTSTEMTSSAAVSSSTEVTSSAEVISSDEASSSTEDSEVTTSTEAITSSKLTSSTGATSSAEVISSTEAATSAEATTSTDVTSSAKVMTSTEVTSDKATSSDEVTSSAEATSSVNACLAGIGSLGGEPPKESRLHDCEVYNTVTVSPFPETSTVFKREVVFHIPTALPTGLPNLNRRIAPAEGEPTATTIQPTTVPPYATYCDSPSEYYEACSAAGVTAFTTTLPTPDATTTTSDVNDCGIKRMIKRGGERLGYEFEENWDAHVMPGVTLYRFGF